MRPPIGSFLLTVSLAQLLITAPAWAAKIVLVAGGGTNPGEGVPATEAQLKEPFGVSKDSKGHLYIVEMAQGERLRMIGDDGKVRTVAGTGVKGSSGDNGPALQAQFNGMHNLLIAKDGIVYLTDTWNRRVRAYDPKTGTVHSVVGSGEKGFGGDGGPALEAKFGGIYCIAFNKAQDHLYMADLENRRIRVWDLKKGTVDTVAGNGAKGVPEDGAVAKNAPLLDPRAVTVDSQGNVYILERNGNALRVVDPAGKIHTVVNSSGKPGGTGDGGDALDATMTGPKHLCVDHEDNVIIADAESHLVRKYLAAQGRMLRVAGTGKKGTAGVGGTPEQCELNRPHGVYVDDQGILYITDSYNNRVLKIVP